MSTKILEERIKSALSPVDKDRIYDDFLDECYGNINIGVTFNASYVLKNLDRICYDIGLDEYFDSYTDDFYELDGEYYRLSEVDELKNQINFDECFEQHGTTMKP